MSMGPVCLELIVRTDNLQRGTAVENRFGTHPSDPGHRGVVCDGMGLCLRIGAVHQAEY